MIQVRNLTKNYGPRRAIHNLNFTVNKGDVVGFLGPNGAGKSTTMKIITGFMAPSEGTASVAGHDVFENPIEVKKHIGYLPETPPVYGDMYVKDYLAYVAALKQVPSTEIQKHVERAIEKTHLGEVQGRLIQHLSKGFRQRVGIAQAIVSNPEVLILDEPTVGLDPKQVAEIRDLILGLKGEHTIILSTHILSEVEATCEKIIIIDKGEIVAEDSIQNLSAMEKGKQRLKIRLRREVNDMHALLSSVSGINLVEVGASKKEWTVDINGDESGIESVAKILVDQGCGLVELTPSRQDLEDVFLKLTYGREQGRGTL